MSRKRWRTEGEGIHRVSSLLNTSGCSRHAFVMVMFALEGCRDEEEQVEEMIKGCEGEEHQRQSSRKERELCKSSSCPPCCIDGVHHRCLRELR